MRRRMMLNDERLGNAATIARGKRSLNFAFGAQASSRLIGQDSLQRGVASGEIGGEGARGHLITPAIVEIEQTLSGDKKRMRAGYPFRSALLARKPPG